MRLLKVLLGVLLALLAVGAYAARVIGGILFVGTFVLILIIAGSGHRPGPTVPYDRVSLVMAAEFCLIALGFSLLPEADFFQREGFSWLECISRVVMSLLLIGAIMWFIRLAVA